MHAILRLIVSSKFSAGACGAGCPASAAEQRRSRAAGCYSAAGGAAGVPDRQARGRADQGSFVLAVVVSLHLVQAKWTSKELEELKTVSLLLLVNLVAVCVVHDAGISSRRTHV